MGEEREDDELARELEDEPTEDPSEELIESEDVDEPEYTPEQTVHVEAARSLELKATEVQTYGGNPATWYRSAARHWEEAGDEKQAEVCNTLAEQHEPKKEEPETT